MHLAPEAHKLTFLMLLRDLSEQLGWPCPALEGCGEFWYLNMFLLFALEMLSVPLERSPLLATGVPLGHGGAKLPCRPRTPLPGQVLLELVHV